MTKKQKAALAVAALEKEYPDTLCSLEEKEPYRLLIAVRLSAQCTDARVNLVTPVLFERFPTLESLAFADVAEVEEIVHPCGFFRAKANDIVSMSRMLIEKYDSKVPDTIEELVKLPGVGRKTANLIVGDVYGKPAVVADDSLVKKAKDSGVLMTLEMNNATVLLFDKEKRGNFDVLSSQKMNLNVFESSISATSNRVSPCPAANDSHEQQDYVDSVSVPPRE